MKKIGILLVAFLTLTIGCEKDNINVTPIEETLTLGLWTGTYLYYTLVDDTTQMQHSIDYYQPNPFIQFNVLNDSTIDGDDFALILYPDVRNGTQYVYMNPLTITDNKFEGYDKYYDYLDFEFEGEFVTTDSCVGTVKNNLNDCIYYFYTVPVVLQE